MDNWYKLTVDETLQKLTVDLASGLSDTEAKQRLQTYGANELVDRGTKSPWLILLDQVKDLMVIILLAAGAVSFFLGEVTDVIVIMAIVVLNAIIGFSQEYRAEQAIAALKKLAVPTVKVKRNGRIAEISARELVPGDMVLLEAGNLVPADGRLVESVNLKVQEAALTGESEPVDKNVAAIQRNDLGVGDRHNMIFMGTVITYGRGTVVITETGMNTELGNIAELIQGVEQEQTPLQRRLDSLGKSLAWAVLVIITIVMIIGFVIRDPAVPLVDTLEVLFLTAISMAVAAVPEGLPAVVTITLALGSQRMLKRHALIRKLPAVETLGSVTVICSDKTGTLTENRMTVTVLDVAGHTQEMETLVDTKGAIFDAELAANHAAYERTLSLLVKAGALCNDAVLQKTDDGLERTIGDPTEGALVVAAAKLGHTKERMEEQWPRVAEVPFTSERKRMTTIHHVDTAQGQTDAPWNNAEFVAFSKGGVDSLLDTTAWLWNGAEIVSMDEAVRNRVLEANARLAQQGQRVLGVAFRPMDEIESVDEDLIETDMIFIGLVAMIDPPRPEVKDAVTTARSAGIRPIMITGDHPLTAQNIAK
ncbi:MAG: HAD-IC family P-type ATPase, partial [Anaerolineales bacterium]|nr:HAD-IC family P-type ATPase [Anaerolineales bacterium]